MRTFRSPKSFRIIHQLELLIIYKYRIRSRIECGEMFIRWLLLLPPPEFNYGNLFKCHSSAMMTGGKEIRGEETQKLLFMENATDFKY